MSKIKLFSLKKSIAIALKKPAGDTIPRRGERHEDIDCNIVSIETSFGSGWVVSADQHGLIYQLYGSDGKQDFISWQEALTAKIEFKHYLSYYEFSCESPTINLARTLLRTHRAHVAKEKVRQLLFNRKKLVRTDKIKILRHLLEMRISNINHSISSVTLLGELHGMRAHAHPSANKQLRYYQLVCESLSVSGDLIKNPSDLTYTLSPKALGTLASYEEEEKKHRELTVLQIIMAILTFALVISGIAEAAK